MDAQELARLLWLCAHPGTDDDELRDLARLAVAEIREHRRLLADLQAALKRAAMEQVT